MFCHLLIRLHACMTQCRLDFAKFVFNLSKILVRACCSALAVEDITPLYVSVSGVCFIFNFELKMTFLPERIKRTDTNLWKSFVRPNFRFGSKALFARLGWGEASTVAVQSSLFPDEICAIGSHTIPEACRKVLSKGLSWASAHDFCT